MYAFNKFNEQENPPDVVTGMIRVFDFTAYALLYSGASLSFVTPYVSMNFEILLSNLANNSMYPDRLVNPF